MNDAEEKYQSQTKFHYQRDVLLTHSGSKGYNTGVDFPKEHLLYSFYLTNKGMEVLFMESLKSYKGLFFRVHGNINSKLVSQVPTQRSV